MDATLVAALGAELHAFVARAGTRRALPVTCHVGRPGGESVVLPAGVDWDAALRADAVERAVDGLGDPSGCCAWVTRSGELDVTDDDLAWCAAARQGLARHGLGLAAFPVLTRRGWRDLLSGEERRWQRVRTRSRG